MWTVLDQDDRRMRGGDVCPQCVNRSRALVHAPLPLFDGVDEHVRHDTVRAAIDQRREFLYTRVRFAPIPKNHRDRRAAAERLGLRHVRHVERHRARVRSGRDDGAIRRGGIGERERDDQR